MQLSNAVHEVISQEKWNEARQALLAREKELTRLRDELTQERRRLPWVAVNKSYEFATSAGMKTLSDLFDGKHQLVVYHFMFAPGWAEGCKVCSFLCDHIDATLAHLVRDLPGCQQGEVISTVTSTNSRMKPHA